ncbi:hypothetical protein WLU96_22355, partial [Bordetella bronchiseptica]
SRDPLELVRQTCGGHHQYPDGFILFHRRGLESSIRSLAELRLDCPHRTVPGWALLGNTRVRRPSLAHLARASVAPQAMQMPAIHISI